MGRLVETRRRGRLAVRFDQIDTNKDGYLDKEELRRVARRMLAMQKKNADAQTTKKAPCRSRL